MTDDLGKLPWLIAHSRRTRRIIVQNIGLALAIKGVFLALAIPGLANLWLAILADMGASLMVTFNGLRLLRPTDLARLSVQASPAQLTRVRRGEA